MNKLTYTKIGNATEVKGFRFYGQGLNYAKKLWRQNKDVVVMYNKHGEVVVFIY